MVRKLPLSQLDAMPFPEKMNIYTMSGLSITALSLHSYVENTPAGKVVSKISHRRWQQEVDSADMLEWHVVTIYAPTPSVNVSMQLFLGDTAGDFFFYQAMQTTTRIQNTEILYLLFV